MLMNVDVMSICYGCAGSAIIDYASNAFLFGTNISHPSSINTISSF